MKSSSSLDCLILNQWKRTATSTNRCRPEDDMKNPKKSKETRWNFSDAPSHSRNSRTQTTVSLWKAFFGVRLLSPPRPRFLFRRKSNEYLYRIVDWSRFFLCLRKICYGSERERKRSPIIVMKMMLMKNGRLWSFRKSDSDLRRRQKKNWGKSE